MSNTLTIELTTFKIRGSANLMCGYTAMDAHSDTFCRVSSTWEGFKAEYPTLKSLVDQVMGEEAFSYLNAAYSVEGNVIEVNVLDEVEAMLTSIVVVGGEGIY